MVKCPGTWTVMAVLALALACGPAEETAMAERASAQTKARTSQLARSLPPAAVLISHRVADYDAWKAAFDDHVQARRDASCLGHYLKRGVDDPNTVYMYCLATDVDKLRAFLEGADLAQAMKRAGVEGAPTITVMKPMSRDLVPKQLLPGIIVMHQVENYDAWRVAYDGFDEFRRESGIVGHAVTQEYGHPNHVIVYHQARNVAALRAFVDSPELQGTMQRAGVVGAPEIHFIRVVDFADY
jgi:quinol monooxygenase YgiN